MGCIRIYGMDPGLLEVATTCARDQNRSLSNLAKHALVGYLKRYGYKVPEGGEKAVQAHGERLEGDNKEV